MQNDFPRLLTIRQNFPAGTAIDLKQAVAGAAQPMLARIGSGQRVAIGVGSRGISNLQLVVREVVHLLQDRGAKPFIVPAMGSHGGATPEGQAEILAGYGVTEAAVGAPIKPSLEVEQIGLTDSGVPVYCSTEALRADGIVLINRIKPHTDFQGIIGSGIIKMIVIGLGKRTGAAAFHAAASKAGYDPMLRAVSRVALKKAPILGGLGLIENQLHETARIAWVPAEGLEAEEEKLFAHARSLMPRLPFGTIDLLIIDYLGKNISGAGMDPNITGRGVQGYSSSLSEADRKGPAISRIFVRDLTPETHGNAIGIGLADVTTSRLVGGMDKQVTYVNAMTSLTPHTAKIPIHFDTDRQAIGMALNSLALPRNNQARVVRIRDTLTLDRLEVSEEYAEEVQRDSALSLINGPRELAFDAGGNLLPLGDEK